MTHPLITSLQQIERLVFNLNLLLHLMSANKLTGVNLSVLDESFEDILCRVENVRMKLERYEVEP